MDNALKLLSATMEQLDWKTVPMVWEQTLEWEEGSERPNVVENNFIGGYDDLVKTFEKTEEDD